MGNHILSADGVKAKGKKRVSPGSAALIAGMVLCAAQRWGLDSCHSPEPTAALVPCPGLAGQLIFLLRARPEWRFSLFATSGGSTIRSGADLMVWRKQRGISRKLFAQMADCSERTLATCEKASILPEKIARPITETVRLLRALRELAGDDTALKDWLVTPNPAFDRKMPLTLIRNGEADLLWEMVYQLRQGAFA